MKWAPVEARDFVELARHAPKVDKAELDKLKATAKEIAEVMNDVASEKEGAAAVLAAFGSVMGTAAKVVGAAIA